MVDTSDEWIMSRVVIKERRILKEDGLGTSFMASIAVQRLLKATHTDPSEVQMLVCHTVTPDMVFTATSNIICDKCGKVLDVVGLPEPPSLDRQAEETNPIKVSYHELVFRGLCGECAGIK